VPKVGIALSILSVFPFLTIWYVMLARDFFRLGRAAG
jgi:hypothetical protein